MRNNTNDDKKKKKAQEKNLRTHTHTRYLKTRATKHIIINSVIKSVASFVLFMPALLLLL